MARQSKSIGTLTQNAPIRWGSHPAGESSVPKTPQTANARLSRSGISCVSASISAMLSKMPQTASAVSAAQLMPNSPCVRLSEVPKRRGAAQRQHAAQHLDQKIPHRDARAGSGGTARAEAAS